MGGTSNPNEGSINYWIINHIYKSYSQHNDLIGLLAKRDENGNAICDEKRNRIPYWEDTNKIKIGDKIVYYCPQPESAAIGIFEITDGPGKFSEDWKESVHFKIKALHPMKKENWVSFHVLLNELDFFKDYRDGKISKKAAASRLMGGIKRIKLEDFQFFEKKFLEPAEERSPLSETSLHLEMIRTTHLQSDEFNCESYIAPAERNRVIESLPQEEPPLDSIIELPSWLSEMGIQLGTISEFSQIDNIWFLEETPGFKIPYAVFEHEKDGNLPRVIDRFSALAETLEKNPRFKDIKPFYFVISKDTPQNESYKSRIKGKKKWVDFQEENKLDFFPHKEISNKNKNYIKILTSRT